MVPVHFVNYQKIFQQVGSDSSLAIVTTTTEGNGCLIFFYQLVKVSRG